MKPDKSLEILLDLDGMVIEQEGGYWTKFEVREVPKTEHMPHGIRYSLTLHDRDGTRMMGFDNAHAIKTKSYKKTYDHRHRHAADAGVSYLFVDAYHLLKDFWQEVDETLNSLGLIDEEQ